MPRSAFSLLPIRLFAPLILAPVALKPPQIINMATKPVFAEDDKRRPSATDIAGIPHDSDSGEYGTKTERPDEVYEQLPFWTRMGCTPESFKRRTAADEHNQLNRTLKGRHLHMIAIGTCALNYCDLHCVLTIYQVAPLVLVSSSVLAALSVVVVPLLS